MRKRGRPPKFNRPSKLVAMTLPEDVIKTLRERNTDLAQAVVALSDESRNWQAPKRQAAKHRFADLVEIAPSSYLVTVQVGILKGLPGCELVPFGPDTAFLALPPGGGLADLALAVADRLEEPSLDAREREMLVQFRQALRSWMRDKKLTYETRSIVVIRRPLKGVTFRHRGSGRFAVRSFPPHW